MTADQLVESLLDDPNDDLKAFASEVPDMLLTNIAQHGLRIEDIDGVEVYGMVDTHDTQERVAREIGGGLYDVGGDVKVFGVSVHKIGGGLYDIGGDYSSAQEAVAVAKKLYVMLRSQVRHEIHFIDET